jgi:hypothetical protein
MVDLRDFSLQFYRASATIFSVAVCMFGREIDHRCFELKPILKLYRDLIRLVV